MGDGCTRIRTGGGVRRERVEERVEERDVLGRGGRKGGRLRAISQDGLIGFWVRNGCEEYMLAGYFIIRGFLRGIRLLLGCAGGRATRHDSYDNGTKAER